MNMYIYAWHTIYPYAYIWYACVYISVCMWVFVYACYASFKCYGALTYRNTSTCIYFSMYKYALAYEYTFNTISYSMVLLW